MEWTLGVSGSDDIQLCYIGFSSTIYKILDVSKLATERLIVNSFYPLSSFNSLRPRDAYMRQ